MDIIFGISVLIVWIYLLYKYRKIWISEWWEKHICSDFAKSGHHPTCHSCNDTNESCYSDLSKCEAYREETKNDIITFFER